MEEALRDFLIRECERRNLSWARASIQAGLDRTAISRFVNGTQPTTASALKLAAFFEVPELEMMAMAGHLEHHDPLETSDELDREILAIFRMLPDSLKRVAIAQLDVWLDHRETWPEGE